MSSASQSLDEKTLFYHRYIEAFKFANGQKKHIRDPRVVSDKVSTKFKLYESYIPVCLQITGNVIIKSNRQNRSNVFSAKCTLSNSK